MLVDSFKAIGHPDPHFIPHLSSCIRWVSIQPQLQTCHCPAITLSLLARTDYKLSSCLVCHWHLICFKHNLISHSSTANGASHKGSCSFKILHDSNDKTGQGKGHKDLSKSGGDPQHSSVDQCRKSRGMGEGTCILSIPSRQKARC